MPNWCFNSLQVEGPREKIDELIEKANHMGDEEEPTPYCMSFKNFLPYPNGEWDYNWCVDNWGTKWDACDPYLEDGGGQDILYSFNTAWSPPTPVVEKMIKMYPELSFKMYYEEPGCDFQGELEGSNGEITNDLCESFHPECAECCLRDYPSEECSYDEEICDWLCPNCYIALNELKDWDEEINE